MFPEVPVEQLNKNGQDTLVSHLGIEFTEVRSDCLVARMPVDNRTVQPMRLLHGGATAALAETMGSVASVILIDISTHFIVGTEISVSHLKSARSGYVTGYCRPIHVGKTSHVWEIQVKNEDGQMVGHSKLTTRILERRK